MMKDITEIFSSITEFHKRISTRKTNSTFYGVEASENEDPQWKSFCGTENMSSANRLLLYGDAENSKKLQNVRIKNSGKFTEMYKKQIIKDVCGFLPCIPAYLSGQPRNMFTCKSVQSKCKIITIVVNTSVPYFVSTDQIINAGAGITSIICSLEKANIRVNLYVGVVLKNKNQKLSLLVKVKNSGDPLNKMKITYPLVNPSFLRRHVFKWMETLPDPVNKKFRSNYGHVGFFDRNVISGAKIINLFNLIENNKSIEQIEKDILSDC